MEKLQWGGSGYLSPASPPKPWACFSGIAFMFFLKSCDSQRSWGPWSVGNLSFSIFIPHDDQSSYCSAWWFSMLPPPPSCTSPHLREQLSMTWIMIPLLLFLYAHHRSVCKIYFAAGFPVLRTAHCVDHDSRIIFLHFSQSRHFFTLGNSISATLSRYQIAVLLL